MRWSERQQAMLQEMGIRVWTPAETVVEPVMDTQDHTAVKSDGDAPAKAARGVATPERRPSPVASPPVHEWVASPAPAARRPMPIAAAATDMTAVSGMDWATLEATVAACSACGLCEGRHQTVFGTGHRQAEWMLVGEAPGEQEDLQGEPFVGKAGQLLDPMLRAVGLTRAEADPAQQVYIANVLKCRPPGNRNPEPAEIASCEPYLQRQVALVQPKLIVAMGRFAVQSLLRSSEPIGRLRGKVHQYQGVPVVVTYHPAYLLRNPLDKARAWEDLCLAREVLQAPGGA